MNKKSIIILLIFLSIFVTYGVLAHSIIISDGGTEFDVNEEVIRTYGFNLSNTDTESNYTLVEIRLPNSFEFIQNSNITTNSNNTIFLYNETSKILSWQNTYGLVPATLTESFYFDARSNQPGEFNISVTGTGEGLVGDLTNRFNVSVNDTTAPTITYNSPENPKYTNLSEITFNISAEDYTGVNTLILKIYSNDANNSLINETITTNPSIYLVLLNLTEGDYYYNVSVNDTNGNLNNGEIREITIDKTAPEISLDATSTGEETLSIGFIFTELGSGMAECGSIWASGGSTNPNEYPTLTGFTVSGLTCENTYTYNVTCKDNAGNSNSTSKSFTTSSCDSGGDSGSSNGGNDGDGGGSDDDSEPISLTYVVPEVQFNQGYTRALAEKDAMRFKVKTESHTLKVTKINSGSISINVSSKTQQADLKEGEIKKFDVDEDKFYELSVKLEGIKNSKANITIVSVYERVPQIIENPVNQTLSLTENLEQNETDGNKSVLSTITGFSSKVFEKIKVPEFLKNKWLWIGLLAAAAIIYGAIYFVREDDGGLTEKVMIAEDSKDIKVH